LHFFATSSQKVHKVVRGRSGVDFDFANIYISSEILNLDYIMYM